MFISIVIGKKPSLPGFTSPTCHLGGGAWVNAPSFVEVLWFSGRQSVDQWFGRRKEEEGNPKSPSLAERYIHAQPLHDGYDGYVRPFRFFTSSFTPFNFNFKASAW